MRKKLPPLRFHRRRRGALMLMAIFAALVSLAGAVADRQGWFWFDGDDMGRYDGKAFRVLRAVDGDTLLLDTPDVKQHTSTTRIRLWGLDTPETAKPDRGLPAEPFADAAHDFTRQRSEHMTVTLALEPHRVRDKFGRVLAHVRLPDQSWLNEQLLLQGMARLETRYAHGRMDRYEVLAYEARQRKRGLWQAPAP